MADKLMTLRAKADEVSISSNHIFHEFISKCITIYTLLTARTTPHELKVLFRETSLHYSATTLEQESNGKCFSDDSLLFSVYYFNRSQQDRVPQPRPGGHSI